MLRVVEMLNDTALLLDVVISIIGLSFFCGTTYAMRWIPGRAMDVQDDVAETLKTAADEFPEIHVLNMVECNAKQTTDNREKEALAME